jgi:hypothetical protein
MTQRIVADIAAATGAESIASGQAALTQAPRDVREAFSPWQPE